jgi:hypothetical protein
MTKLGAADTAAFVAKWGIRADDVPSYGLRIVDGGKDYLVGVRHATGEIGVWDVTAYDPSTGARIDPALLDQSSLETLADAIWKGTAESISQTPAYVNDLLKLAAIGVGVYLAAQAIQLWKSK